VNQEPLAATTKHLIIVPGHAVYVGQSAADVYFGANWKGTYTGPRGYRFDDEVPLYVRHVQRGIDLVQRNEEAALVLSGGRTRAVTPISESYSYLTLAQQLD